MLRRRRLTIPDDPIIPIVRRDMSGGMNTRQHEQIIGENQAVKLQNILLETAGSRSLRSGQTRIDANFPGSSAPGYGLFGFDPDGGTFELLAIQGVNLSGNGGGATFSNYKTDLTTGLQTTIIKAGQLTQNDIAIVSNGTDNLSAMYQDHSMHDLGDTNTSPPKTPAIAYYGDRVWALLRNLLYFSDAFPADYSLAFDRTTNAFRVPVGAERALISTRDQGIVVMGSDQIWQFLPSYIPAVTDTPQKVLDIGCVNGYTAVQVADDIMFLAPDGVRGLFRTQLDKLQTGQSFPLSWVLQDEFNEINWAHIDKACAVFFENKYIISLPTGTSTTNNKCWVYYPALSAAFYSSTNLSNQSSAAKCWVVYDGWNIGRFTKLRVNGQERLYGIDSVTGKVYRLFYGSTDNTNPIVYEEITRAEDFGQPLVYKKGGEFRIKATGGNGTLTIYANADNSGYVQLGTMELEVTGVTFPTTFPMLFANTEETIGSWHLDDAGIQKFKRVKFKIYCNTSAALITILENIATAFVEQYLSEE